MGLQALAETERTSINPPIFSIRVSVAGLLASAIPNEMIAARDPARIHTVVGMIPRWATSPMTRHSSCDDAEARTVMIDADARRG